MPDPQDGQCGKIPHRRGRGGGGGGGGIEWAQLELTDALIMYNVHFLTQTLLMLAVCLRVSTCTTEVHV